MLCERNDIIRSKLHNQVTRNIFNCLDSLLKTRDQQHFQPNQRSSERIITSLNSFQLSFIENFKTESIGNKKLEFVVGNATNKERATFLERESNIFRKREQHFSKERAIFLERESNIRIKKEQLLYKERRRMHRKENISYSEKENCFLNNSQVLSCKFASKYFKEIVEGQ